LLYVSKHQFWMTVRSLKNQTRHTPVPSAKLCTLTSNLWQCMFKMPLIYLDSSYFFFQKKMFNGIKRLPWVKVIGIMTTLLERAWKETSSCQIKKDAITCIGIYRSSVKMDPKKIEAIINNTCHVQRVK